MREESGFYPSAKKMVYVLSLNNITLGCKMGNQKSEANSYLEDYRRSRLDLQYPSITERVKGRVGIICKWSAIEDEDGGHVVQDEAELVRMKACLGCLALCVDYRRSEAGHGGVVYHHTHLKENIRVVNVSWVHGYMAATALKTLSLWNLLLL